jgi:predicted amidohydrolase
MGDDSQSQAGGHRVAAIQFQIALHDPEANLARAGQRLREAAAAGAELVVFPELCLTGPIEDRVDLIDNGGRWRDAWCELAVAAGVDVVAGSLIEGTPQARRNRSYLISADGRALAHYDKRRLWKSERPHTLAGESIAVGECKVGRVGLAICWDLTDPDHFARLAAAGAELVAVPAYWCRQLRGPEVQHALTAEATHVDSLCVARALENSCAVIFANAAGECVPCNPEQPKRLLGHSQIAMPFLGAIGKSDYDEDDMVMAEVRAEVLRDARELYGLPLMANA